MGDKNLIRTLGHYSKPSHEGYRNTIELPAGNNVVPLQSHTIRLVQNGCSLHGLWSEDPNQHLKDFFKLVDSLDLDDENRNERASGSITMWEDLTTRFLAQFFPPGRTAKLRNDILMFQQHHGVSLSKAWTHLKDLLQKVPYHGINRWLIIQIFYYDPVQSRHKTTHLTTRPGVVPSTSDRHLIELKNQVQCLYDHVSFHLKCEIDRAAGGKFCNKNTDESLEIIENLILYDHEGWGEIKEFVKPDYMAAHNERMERFENTILKQREGINSRMTEMFGLLKELTASRTPEKVLIREEAKFPITKNVNSISLTKGEEERGNIMKIKPDNTKKPTTTEAEMPVMEAETKNGVENRAENKSIKTPENKEIVELPSSQPITYYLSIRSMRS
ncbi:zinc finger, CCHC-type containing protein [Tanacetum coccineum]|uniref:Zinc finger, CCHC-type containing protein n=1 Tax=Tanacetum coccineum TaxID=301880 RepID=A0ABQ5FQH4_9ASTR